MAVIPNFYTVVILFGWAVNLAYSFNPLSYVTSIVFDATRYMGCSLVHCCDDDWTTEMVDVLDKELKYKLYGQHIAHSIVVNSLRNHVRLQNRKPLVLSFHGWPGGGKNYVSNFIVKSLFQDKSPNVHMFSGRLHFPYDDKAHIYGVELSSWIQGNASKCDKAIFIFDEVDKMPPRIFDYIKPLLDHDHHLTKVQIRNVIFLFLSNTGSQNITQKMVDLWSRGVKRENIQISDFEDLIAKGSFNEPGGFHKSEAIQQFVIDHYVPFLPLEEEHVRKCIEDAFREKGMYRVKEHHIMEVLEHITFGPGHHKIYSTSGCKKISQKVGMIAEKLKDRSEL